MPFAPTDISGLKGWYKADGTLWQDSARTTAATADADPVGSWDDASGIGNHALQATAGKRPTLKTGIPNGKPVVRFNIGAATDLQSTFAATLTQPNTIFVVGSGDTAQFYYFFDGITGTNRNAFGRGLSTGAWYGIYAGTAAVEQPQATPTGILPWLCVFNGASSRFRRGSDGVQSTSGDVGSNTWTGITIGARNSGAGDFLQGDIAEIVAYNALLTDAQIDQVGNYLASKYALTWVPLVFIPPRGPVSPRAALLRAGVI